MKPLHSALIALSNKDIKTANVTIGNITFKLSLQVNKGHKSWIAATQGCKSRYNPQGIEKLEYSFDTPSESAFEGFLDELKRLARIINA